MDFSYKPVNPFQDDGLSKEDRTMLDGMRNTAYICGYRGEDVEYAIHQALKRMGRYDLLPPCEKDKVESEDKECSTTKNDLEVIEDIKAEIELHHMNDLAYDEMSDFERGVLSIIDKHISGKEN